MRQVSSLGPFGFLSCNARKRQRGQPRIDVNESTCPQR
jgi:hypothetical protein